MRCKCIKGFSGDDWTGQDGDWVFLPRAYTLGEDYTFDIEDGKYIVYFSIYFSMDDKINYKSHTLPSRGKQSYAYFNNETFIKHFSISEYRNEKLNKIGI